MAPALLTVTLTGLPDGSAALTEVKKSATVVPVKVTKTSTNEEIESIVTQFSD
jgi:hypothetical protein